MTSLMKRRDKGKWMNRVELSGRRKKEEVAGGEIKKRPRWRGICQIRQQMRKIQVLLKGGKETTEEKG